MDLTDLIGLQCPDKVDVHALLIITVVLGNQLLGAIFAPSSRTPYCNGQDPTRSGSTGSVTAIS